MPQHRVWFSVRARTFFQHGPPSFFSVFSTMSMSHDLAHRSRFLLCLIQDRAAGSCCWPTPPCRATELRRWAQLLQIRQQTAARMAENSWIGGSSRRMVTGKRRHKLSNIALKVRALHRQQLIQRRLTLFSSVLRHDHFDDYRQTVDIIETCVRLRQRTYTLGRHT